MKSIVTGRVSLYIPNKHGGEEQLNFAIALDELQVYDMKYIVPEPPPFDHPYELIRWQERLSRSNEACDALGRSVARAFREAFQKRAMRDD